MKKNTYEIHIMPNPGLPLVFHTDIISNGNIYTHWHENTEFLYCIEGSGTVFSDSKEIQMNKGDVIVINSKHVHRVSSEQTVAYYCLIIANSFFIENEINIANINFDEKFTDANVGDLIENIRKAYIAKTSEYFVAENRAALMAFMTYMAKNHSYKISDSKINSKSYTAILDSINYIDEHFADKLSIDDIANQSGYSKYHFARLFKETTGCTIVDHIKAKRCENAKNMLLNTTKSISQICTECGFDYGSYFSKTFKEQYGCLPFDFRKKYSKIK